MEDKQIIELYWERSRDAIHKTEEKYGQYASYIVYHILQDEAETEHCTKDSYEMLWETIPPYRPQNLKAYLCKVTRNHALQMKYPEFIEQGVNLFDAELVIYDFLKGLEQEQRKLFVARYWYLSSVSEIAMQYKMSEAKVDKIVLSLRQKLDGVLEEKNIHLKKDEDLLFAMTEIEDRYLEEAAPIQGERNVGSDEVQDSKSMIQKVWKKYQISIMACTLFLIFVLFVWPKNPIQENPYESGSENGYFDSGTGIGGDKITIDIGLEDIVQVLDGDIMSAEDFDKLAEKLPWKEDRDIAALPIYKNLSYTGALGAPVYLDEGDLWTIVENIAAKLEMEIIGSSYTSVADENSIAATGIIATTNWGTIEVNGRGEVYVSFTDGVTLPPSYELSSEASKTNADKNVDFLISYYWDVIGSDDLTPDSYATYDLEGNRQMNHRAVGTRNSSYDIESYYFNQVYFYHNDQGKLTGIRFGDCRIAAESLGFYPLITLQEAKTLLKEGKYDTNAWADFVYDEANIRRIELLYQTNKTNEYYQPYYCFYMLLEDRGTYGKFYVPAAQGVQLYEAPPEPEIKIWDMSDYEKKASEFVYYKDGKYYTVGAGKVIEGDQNELLAYKSTGHVEVEHLGTEGAVTYFYYGDSEALNLDEVMAGKNYSSLGAMYIDGKVLILSVEYINNTSYDMATTCYLYSLEDGSLIQTIESTPSRVNEWGEMGLIFHGDQYATNVNSDRNVEIVDAITGSRYSTGIYYQDVSSIRSAGEQHLAIVCTNGEIAIVEKTSGQIIKKSKFKVNFDINGILYKDDLLYVETWTGGYYVFVISEFE